MMYSDLVLKQGLEAILQDMAKEWEKAVPDSTGTQQ